MVVIKAIMHWESVWLIQQDCDRNLFENLFYWFSFKS